MKNPIELLEEIRRLMELKGENRFKTLAFQKAAQQLAGREDLAERAKAGTLTEIPGIGKSISEVLTEFILTGESNTLAELQKEIPAGLIELTQIPGLGAKKAWVLIEELGIQSIAELEYACRENRLIKLKGFGPKLQAQILEGISFRNANQGLQKYSDVDELAEKLLGVLREANSGLRVEKAGELRRQLEILSGLEFLVEEDVSEAGTQPKPRVQAALQQFIRGHALVLPVTLSTSPKSRFGYEWAKATGTQAHWEALGSPSIIQAATEEEFYQELSLPWIPPETRETGEEVRLARLDPKKNPAENPLNRLLPWNGIRGVFHNHTTRSDGAATLEEMVISAKALGFEYIGISDHSQTAFYANGLRLDHLDEQEVELRQVQKKHPEIRIFWGIESDILADGSLDYPAEVLERFDFVIASIHSRFKMDREAMTHRILTAIRNPFTRFLGHPTGRLLLGRKGYDVDMERIMAEAAQYQVAVELNSNPARLDLDWRWGPVMRRYGTMTSVNPDAHEIEGLTDIRYGIAMARKALIPVEQVVNAAGVGQVEKWLKRQ